MSKEKVDSLLLEVLAEADEDSEDSLPPKYEVFSPNGKQDFYLGIVTGSFVGNYAFSYLLKALSPQSLRDQSYYFSQAYADLRYDQESKAEAVWDASMASPTSKYELTGDTFRVFYKQKTLSTILLFPKTDFGKSKEFDAARGDVIKVLRALFPKFEVPTKVFGSDTITVSNRVYNEDYKAEYFIEDLKKFRPLFDSLKIPPMEQDDDYKYYKGLVSLQLHIEPNSIVIKNRSYRSDQQLQELTNSVDDIILEVPIKVTMVYNFPREVAEWCVGANLKGVKFIPALFLQYVNTYVNYISEGKTPAGGFPDRFMPLNKVAEQARQEAKKFPEISKPRTNKEGFTILKDGSVMLIPEVDDSKAYMKALDLVSDEVPFQKAMKDGGLADKVLLTDWIDNVLIFGDSNADLSYVDLQGAKPLDDVTIARYMNSQLGSPQVSTILAMAADKMFAKLHGKLKTINVGEAGKNEIIKYEPENTDNIKVAAKMLSALAIYAANNKNALLKDLLEPETYDKDNQTLIKLQPAVMLLKQLCKIALENLDELPLGVTVRYGIIATMCAVIGEYSKNIDGLVKAYEKGISDNTVEHVDLTKLTSVTIPGLSNLNSLLPHQGKVLYNLHFKFGKDFSPLHAMLQVDPGGGKTLLTISDIALLMAKKNIKRAVVVAPGNLVKEWVSQINDFTGGDINAVPLRTRNIDRLMETLGLTEEEVFNYYNSLPVNSIIITDYNFLAGGKTRNRKLSAGTKSIIRFSNTEFIQRLGPDFVAYDESQRAKNLYAKQSIASRQLSSTTKYIRELSGTMISNTVKDYLGQTALINPTILGTESQFEESFLSNDETGSIAGISANVGVRIADALKPYVAKISVASRDFAYLLPNIKEVLHTVELTDAQQKFYNQLLEEAIIKILADKKLKEKMNQGSEEDEAYIEAKLKFHLATSERFINDPGTNEAFRAIHGSSKELISPKVAKVNQLVEEHFKEDNNKLIIFGYNKATSLHIYEHLDRKDEAIHYSAGNERALLLFKNNPKTKILVADETSLGEGHNLQMASRIIRMQTLWAPGKQDQGIRRIFRPDPAQKYSRESITIDLVLTDRTMEITKFARIVSKTIANTNARLGNDNPSWNAIKYQFESVPPIKLSIDNLKKYTTKGSLQPFMEGYTTLKGWEDKQLQYGRAELLKQVETKIGKKVDSLNDLIKSAFIPVEHEKLPEGKRIFTPYDDGATPIDEYGVGLKPVSLFEFEMNQDNEDDREDEDGNIVDLVTLNKGDIVITEYGAGKVHGVSASKVRVDLGKIGIISFPKTVVFVPTDEEATKKLKVQMKQDPKSVLRLPNVKGLKGRTPLKVEVDTVEPQEVEKINDKVIDQVGIDPNKQLKKPQIKEPEEKPKREKNREDKPIELEIYPATIMGAATLVAWKDTNPGADAFLRNRGYRYIPDSVYFQVLNYKGIQNFLDFCDKKKIKISQKRKDMLLVLAERMRGAKGRINNTNRINTKDIRNFILDTHRKIDTDKHTRTIRPYPVVWDGDLYVMIPIITNPTLVKKLTKQPRIKGLSSFRTDGGSKSFDVHGDFYVKFIGSRNEMEKEIMELGDEVKLLNKKEAKSMIKDLRFTSSNKLK